MSTGSGTTKAKGPSTWLSFGLNNASTIALVLGGFWFVGKPHAENFIVETIELKVAGKLQEQIEEAQADRIIIKTDQRTIRSNQQKIQDEQKKQGELLKRIEKLILDQTSRQ